MGNIPHYEVRCAKNKIEQMIHVYKASWHCKRPSPAETPPGHSGASVDPHTLKQKAYLRACTLRKLAVGVTCDLRSFMIMRGVLEASLVLPELGGTCPPSAYVKHTEVFSN